MGIFSATKRHIKEKASSDHTAQPATGPFGEEAETKPPAVVDNKSPIAKSTKSESDKFYPAQLEEVVCDGKYTIKGRLGTGRYSSVWLVEDSSSGRHHALKILNVDFCNGKFELFELEVMEKIAQISSTSSHPGKDHVAQLIDHFDIKGPAGNHVCMVFELLGRNIADQATTAQIQRLPSRVVKQITRQLLEALDFIHTECQVIHTDISPQNICIKLADASAAVAATKADASGRIQLSTPSLIQDKSMQICLNDFGIACFTDRHLTDDIEPPLLRAPEVTLGAPWDASVDVFNVGALVLQFLTGQLPFPSRGQKNAGGPPESDRLMQLLKSFGEAPDVVVDNADRAEEFAQDGVDLKRKPTPEDRSVLERFVAQNASGSNDVELDMTEVEVKSACDMLRCMLATDPRLREPARKLLQHPWLDVVQ